MELSAWKQMLIEAESIKLHCGEACADGGWVNAYQYLGSKFLRDGIHGELIEIEIKIYEEIL